MKKASLLLFASLCAIAAAAFDSTAWLEKRAMLDHEAERLAALYELCLKSLNKPAEDVTIAMENYDDGSLKTTVVAKRAQLFAKDDVLWGSGVNVRHYRRGGELEFELDADNCVVDRKTKSGWAPGHARAVYPGRAELEGDGVYFSSPERYVRLTTNTVLRADSRTLRSRRADYDHLEGVAMFDGAVSVHSVAKGEEYDLCASQAFAFLSVTNGTESAIAPGGDSGAIARRAGAELKRIVALGDVAVTNGTRAGSCERVVYMRRDAKLAMYGAKGGRKARLEDFGKRKSSVDGSRITFWLDSEQVEVVDSLVTVDARGVRLPKGGL